jgi:beta-phosphoglucomutase
MIKAVFFDLDGVLVDACDFHYKALNKALGFNISPEEHKTTYNGLSTKKKLEMLVKEGRVNQDNVDTIWELKQKYTQDYMDKLSIDPIKIALHLTLHNNNVESACVTNAIRSTAECMLRKTGQLDFMSFIVSNEDVEKNKPNPEPYIFAMQLAHLLPTEIMIVEDSDIGYESASRVTTNVFRVQDSQDVNIINIMRALRNFNEYSNSDGGSR